MNAAESATRAVVEITPENHWFLERHLNVFDILQIFPLDALSSETARGIPVHFRTDLGFEFESDIDRDKMQLRNRSRHHGWMKWTQARGLNLGDKIVIERTGDRTFFLRLEPKQTPPD